MKIAHESPLSIARDVDQLTDYSYFLVHLLEQNKDYLQWAKSIKALKRESILDNSIFELGSAFDMDKFKEWVKEITPTWYIVPDVLEDAEGTMNNLDKWIEAGNMDYCKESKPIAVVQGKTYQEIVECYRYLDSKLPYRGMIAISFDYSLFREWYPDEPTKFHSYMYGRNNLIRTLDDKGVINYDRKHHLLGCGLPQEFYKYDYPFLYSLDTSNPVVAGIKGMKYDQDGKLEDKPIQKLHELIEYEPSNEDKSMIFFNMVSFRNNVRSV